MLVRLGHRLLAIEIAVTHFVDQRKAEHLRDLTMAAIEIDLSVHLEGPWTWESLRKTVIDGITHKQWLCPLDGQALQQEAHAIATRSAHALPMRQAETMLRRPSTRKRHFISGRIVDLVLLPFGTAVWTPYDPEMIRLIKSIVYPLGGQ